MASSNLQRLGLADNGLVTEKVAILVGPNGSGKSRFLRELAIQIRGDRDLAIISNTAHDRFSGMRGLKRISAGRGSRSPKSIVKRAIGRTIDQSDSRFCQIGAILEYCGYRPRLGFLIDQTRTRHIWTQQISCLIQTTTTPSSHSSAGTTRRKFSGSARANRRCRFR